MNVLFQAVAKEALQYITVDDWRNSCQHIKKIEDEYYQRRKTLYEDIDRTIINLQDDSSISDADTSFEELERRTMLSTRGGLRR